MPKQITQAEIVTVLKHYQDSFEAAIAIRKRLDQEGATVEPGRYSLESEKFTEPVEQFKTDMSEGLNMWGLEIFKSKDPVSDWATKTPEDLDYRLQVMEWNSGLNEELQTVELSRVEYVALKKHLAAMRGIAVPEVPVCQAR